MRRIALAVLAAFLLITAPASAAECLRTLNGVDLQSATVPDLQAAMAEGRITSVELTDAYLARIAAYDTAGPALNSVRQLRDRAREQAATADAERAAGRVRGPLHGIPVLLKDNVATADLPTTAGSIALEGVVPERDATVTERLRAAGAVILGKANLSEFANWVALGMPNGYSSLGGQVLNAHDLGDPSGSSAGSGVAASMAFSGITIGTETSGSIISPSEANGVVGVKTTLGLASRAGILPLAPSFDVPGPIVRTVTDAALVLGAIAGPDPRDPATADAQLPPGGDFTAGLKRDALQGKRLAYSEQTYEDLDDEETALFDAAIERLEQLGATVVPVQALEGQYVGLAEIGAIPNEFKASLNRYLAEEMPTSQRKTLTEIIEFNRTRPDRVKYGQNLLEASDRSPGREELFPVQAEPARQSARADIDAALAEGDADAIIGPGNAHVNVGAAAGYPTVVVPDGYAGGGASPRGLAFMGPAWSDPQLLAFAYAFEQASRVRVAPTEINADLAPGPCATVGGDRGGSAPPAPFVPPPSPPGVEPAPAIRRLRPLRVNVRRRKGRILRVVVRGAEGTRVRLVLRRGKRIVRRRVVRARNGIARASFRLRRRGRYRVTVLDLGPPPRTVRSRLVRVRRPPAVGRYSLSGAKAWART